jgi:iron(III)-enterobactin esterase
MTDLGYPFAMRERFARGSSKALGGVLGAMALVGVACTSSDAGAPDDKESTQGDDAGGPSSSSPTSNGGGSTPAPSPAGGDAGDGGPEPCVRPDPGKDGDGDFTIGPTYADAPELKPAATVPRGMLFPFEMKSTDSKIYPGVTGPYTRKVSVYIPKQYVDGTPAPFMVVQDGIKYVPTLPPILDSMIAAKRLPPIVAIFINSGGGDGRGSERGLEYDRVSEDYSRFIETEVLPIVPQRPDIKAAYPKLRFTVDPEGRAAMGTSSGGAAAFTMAWFRPDLYRRILTYSGTFVNQYPETAYLHGAWEYHERLIPNNAAKPIRVYLEVGENDNNLDATFNDGMHNWITANQRMAKVLKAKAYHYRYQFAAEASHGDGRVIRQTLPSVLTWLWHGYESCPAR